MKTLLTSILVVMLATLTASPVLADVVLSDDFNDSTVGPLAGNIADTGQTWAGAVYELTGTYDALDVGTAYGIGGTNGAGHTGNLRSNGINTGTTLSSDLVRLEADVTSAGGVTRLTLYEAWTGSAFAALKWRQNGEAASQVWFEGLDLDEVTEPAISFSTTALHLTLDVDLTAKTVKYSYYNLLNPTQNGSTDLGTYTPAFAPWEVMINFGGGDGTRGFDNLMLQTNPPEIPEPSTLALLATGLLGLLCYAWRKRK